MVIRVLPLGTCPIQRLLQLPLGPYKKNLVPAVELEQSQALDSDVRAATVLGPSL
jgi:hypothetical protein